MEPEIVSVAPMMEWTDPHFRMLLRGITKKTVLYTEMIVDDTLRYNPNLDMFAGKHIDEEPSVIQLGGSDPETLAKAVEICCAWDGKYGEINLNCGCPSPRVSRKCFGAKLMLDPEHIRRVVYEMTRRSDRPITVKCRIGVDEQDSYEELKTFIMQAHAGGSAKFIIHSRKAILNGLSPKQNRDIPPLKYEVVHRLIEEFPDLKFVLNGGILTLDQAKSHLVDGNFRLPSLCSSEHDQEAFDSSPRRGVHGIMIGRAAYGNPCMLGTVDSEFYGVKDPCLSRRGILERYMDYCEWTLSEQGPTKLCTNGERITTSTMLLLNGMRNIACGLHHVSKWRVALNDLYMEGIKDHKLPYNPDPRTIIESAMELLNEAELDASIGNCEVGGSENGASRRAIFYRQGDSNGSSIDDGSFIGGGGGGSISGGEVPNSDESGDQAFTASTVGATPSIRSECSDVPSVFAIEPLRSKYISRWLSPI